MCVCVYICTHTYIQTYICMCYINTSLSNHKRPLKIISAQIKVQTASDWLSHYRVGPHDIFISYSGVVNQVFQFNYCSQQHFQLSVLSVHLIYCRFNKAVVVCKAVNHLDGLQSPSFLLGSCSLIQDTLMSTAVFLLNSEAQNLGSLGSEEVGKCLWLWASWLACVREGF